MKWEETLWDELDAQSDTDQVVNAGAWIVRITQELLPKLGQRRREKVVQILAGPDMDATKLAETIGTRRTTILRLAEEGRSLRREHNQSERSELE